MHERTERKEQARFARTLTVGETRVTPLVEVKAKVSQHGDRVVSGSGKLTPVGVLIETPEGTRALSLDGDPLPFKEG